jgi:hypothetical protein
MSDFSIAVVFALPAVLAPLPGKPRLDNVPELQASAARIAAEGAWDSG